MSENEFIMIFGLLHKIKLYSPSDMHKAIDALNEEFTEKYLRERPGD